MPGYLLSESDRGALRKMQRELTQLRGRIHRRRKEPTRGGGGDFFLVKVKYLSGADGDDANPPQYVYDVYHLDAVTLIESGVEVIGPRPNGATEKAPDFSYAQATYNEDGDLKLWAVLEKPTDETCA